MLLMLCRFGSLQVLVVFIWLFAEIQATLLVSRDTKTPSPISIPPSQDWDGNDGPWSSFSVQIGTPPQIVKVFISTASTQTWAVATEGCGSGDPTTCPKLRGGIYNYTASTSWVSNLANLSSNIYGLGLEDALGYVGKGRYGFDDVTLGFQGGAGPTLQNQTVAGIAAKEFLLGSFGLRPRPSNFTNYNDPIPSFVENLKNQSKIPSLSWGYTSGNQYRLNEVLGSLTLGGYDSSKFTPNHISFPFSQSDYGTDFAVQINTITTGDTSLLTAPITAFLDSTVPYIYLPVAACDIFESTFGLLYNETSQLYLLNNTQHLLLQTQNPSINFTLSIPSSSSTSSETIDIIFPYAAFDLLAQWPLVDTDTRYFPLKRADNETQYVLGRAFFQEAYLVADYERSNFSLSACNWDASLASTLVPILPLRGPEKKTLGVGVYAGIAGGAVVLIILFVLAWWFWFRPMRKKQQAAELAAYTPLSPSHPNHPTQTGGYQKPELDSQEVSTYNSSTKSPLDLAQEVQGDSLDVIHELPAREEVAIEMTGFSKPHEMGVRHIDEPHDRVNRRWSWLSRSTNASRSPSEAAFEARRVGDDVVSSESGRGGRKEGKGGIYGSRAGEDTLSTLSSGMGSAVISPETGRSESLNTGNWRGSERRKVRGMYGPGSGEDTLSSISSGMGSAVISPETEERSGTLSPSGGSRSERENGRRRERNMYGSRPGDDTLSSISSGMGSAIITPETESEAGNSRSIPGRRNMLEDVERYQPYSNERNGP